MSKHCKTKPTFETSTCERMRCQEDFEVRRQVTVDKSERRGMKSCNVVGPVYHSPMHKIEKLSALFQCIHKAQLKGG